jgi:hypothetical protein
MTELNLGREYYHRIRDIEQWCEIHIGLGDWSDRSEFRQDENLLWSISQMFGTTFIRFRRKQDATLFALRWL